MKKLLIVDLDQTVIDSSIRENHCYPNGKLCLDTYKQVKSCPDNGIVNDTLTPFGEWLKDNYNLLLNNYSIVFLTARLCDIHDFNSFKKLGIADMLTVHCLTIDRDCAALYGGNPKEQHSGKYKKPIIYYLLNAYSVYDVVVIDDCDKVLNMARDNNFRAICARELYHYTRGDFVTLFNSLAKI